jgi:hypothetical protein
MDFDLEKTINNVKWNQVIITNVIIIGCIAFAIYLKNHYHPAMAGMVAVMPIAFVSFYFAKRDHLDTFAFSVGLGLASYSLAAFAFYYFVRYKDYSRLKAILYSMAIWIVTICIFYCLFTDGPYSINGKH